MILALAGQFKQLSHEPEKFRWLNGIRTHDLCDAGAVLSPTELWSHTVESRSICWAHVFPWKECHMKECYMQCGVWNQMKIWSSHLLDNLSNCLMNLKNSGDSTGFEPMTSAMPVQCSHQLSYEVTQWRAGQFVGQRSWVRIPLSHLNFSGSWDNCLNCPASARIISSFDFKHRTAYNILSHCYNCCRQTPYLEALYEPVFAAPDFTRRTWWLTHFCAKANARRWSDCW